MTSVRVDSLSLVRDFAGRAAASGPLSVLDEARTLLDSNPGDERLLRFVGLLHCQVGDTVEGLRLIEAAFAENPEGIVTRRSLVHTLADCGALDRARALCTPDAIRRDETLLSRLLARIETASGRYAEAASLYENILMQSPDAAIWSDLGDVQAALGDVSAAKNSWVCALSLDNRSVSAGLKLVGAYLELGLADDALQTLRSCRWNASLGMELLLDLARAFRRLGLVEEAMPILAAANRSYPAEPDVLVELGLGHAAQGDYRLAEDMYRAALDADGRHPAAHLYLGLLFEHSNRFKDLEGLIVDAKGSGVPSADTALLEAYSLRRSGLVMTALLAAESAPADVEPIRRFQLIGELSDKMGDVNLAFSAFSAMNAKTIEHFPGTRDRARSYRAWLEERLRSMTAERLPALRERPLERHSDTASPIFLLGLPRSGTTLLDTFLLGHRDITILEEPPILQEIDALITSVRGLIDLDAAGIRKFRSFYFRRRAEIAGPAAAPCIIDKHPLHIAQIPLIKIIFPDARIILIDRHPCDVVLSFFITNFAMNDAMANSFELSDAALFYDIMMRCRARWLRDFPLPLKKTRYESIITSPETELRGIVSFLGLEWDDDLLAHQKSATDRGYIASASYAQVTERLHDRSIGRWKRYERYLSPILGTISPWAKAEGYADEVDLCS